MNKVLLFIIVFLLISHHSFAQNKQVLDSLNIAYQIAKNDTSRILILIQTAIECRSIRPDTCITLAKDAYSRSEKINYQKGIAKSLVAQGLGNLQNTNFITANTQLKHGIEISEKIADKENIAWGWHGIAVAYYSQGNYALALEHYQKSMTLAEAINNSTLIARNLNNIGNVYGHQKNFKVALEYYLESLKYNEKANAKFYIANNLQNIGHAYNIQLKFDLANSYFQKCLKIREEIRDIYGLGMIYNNLGNLHKDQGDLESAIEYYQKSLVTKETLNDKKGLLYSIDGLAQVYQKQQNYEKSIMCSFKALAIAKELKAVYEIAAIYATLALTYELNKNFEKALDYYKNHKTLKDSLFNLEKAKSIANMESRMALEKKEKEFSLLTKDNLLTKLDAEKKAKELEITKKQAEAEHLMSLARAEKDKRKQDSLLNLAQKAKLEAENLQIQQEKQDLAFKAEREEQKRIQFTYLAILGTFLIILILVGIGFKQKQKANKQLAAQNNEIKKQQLEIAEKNDSLKQANEELKQSHEELNLLNGNLELQKQTIELTHKELDKSIHYASHIQSVVMPEEKELRSFFTDLFILFRPRDIVSGDFYWFSQISENHAVFSLSDCTGHGVPGAFMSMLGATLLHDFINLKEINDDPAIILKNVHQGIRKILKQEEKRNNDGMDISLCVFKKNPENKTVELIFAGAKSNMSYITNGEIFDLKGDKQYLGGEELKQDFTNQRLILPDDTIFYLYSDGYQDQNNPERKKIGSKTFKNLLLTIWQKDYNAQKNTLENFLIKHQKSAAQRDDISVIALKI